MSIKVFLGNLRRMFYVDLESERARFHSRIQGLDTRLTSQEQRIGKCEGSSQ